MSSINIAGIILDRDGLEPLAGVQIRDKINHGQQTTNANGFYSMQIPIDSGKPKIMLEFAREDYITYSRGLGFRAEDIPAARILIDVLYPESMSLKEELLNSIPQDSPPDPDYAATLTVMEKVRTDHRITIRFREMQNSHPEISLFYVSKDSYRRFVLYRDGHVEGYGGPGEPDFTEMDARYAPLPWHMTNISKEPPKRPSPWQEMSLRAQKDFKPTSGSAKAIVFPGDGNIIVIPAQGDAEIYEMVDAGAPQGRSVFEARYGPLPDYIPVAVKQPGTNDYLVRHEAVNGVGSVEIRSISTAKR